MSKKVFVGLSGGVDSSVSALLLKNKGYDVTGVFIKVWYPDFLNCDWKEERRDAMRVCAKLNIPFKTLDLSKEYKQGVIDYMIHEYKIGNTPNPDVMCNKQVKFGSFFDWAIENGADYVATGHYAQIEKDGSQFILKESVDKEKDQTYFIWNLSQYHLQHTLFPVGKYVKSEVRSIAKKHNLFTENKKDSQGLCFLGDLNMKDFLKEYIKSEPGDVLNEEGEVIGRHDGSIFYTIGQHYMGYVVDKNISKNTITVSDNKPLTSKKSNTIKLEKVNIISGDKNVDTKVRVKIRYRDLLQDAHLSIENKKGSLKFNLPSEDVSPGQSIVFYKNGVCLGGGVVVK